MTTNANTHKALDLRLENGMETPAAANVPWCPECRRPLDGLQSQSALVQHCRHCDVPLRIAPPGEWGAGFAAYSTWAFKVGSDGLPQTARLRTPPMLLWLRISADLGFGCLCGSATITHACEYCHSPSCDKCSPGGICSVCRYGKALARTLQPATEQDRRRWDAWREWREEAQRGKTTP